MENEELGMVESAQNQGIIQGFDAIGRNSNTKTEIFSNITDKKKIFNLENSVDYLLNDCEGEKIHVKEVLVKRFTKPMKEAVIDEETGEILKDKETTMSCILIDDNDKSYATGSKMFTIQLMRYLQNFGIDENGFDIKIIKKKIENGKALQFELV